MIGCAFHIVRWGTEADVASLVPLPAAMFELLELDQLRAEGLTVSNVVAGSAGSQRNGEVGLCAAADGPRGATP